MGSSCRCGAYTYICTTDRSRLISDPVGTQCCIFENVDYVEPEDTAPLKFKYSQLTAAIKIQYVHEYFLYHAICIDFVPSKGCALHFIFQPLSLPR